MTTHTLPLFPETAEVDGENRLVIGGVGVPSLAADYGTPLYLFDEQTLRNQCRAFVREFSGRYPSVKVLYAGKAFLNRPLARLIAEEGLGLDVVSGGETAIAKAAGFPAERVYFHGNNKGQDELALALDWGMGRVVADNLHELALLESLAAARGRSQDILLRVSPSVDPHTHHHTTTGVLDSKFGFALVNGQAEEAVKLAQKAAHLNLVGLHIHLGSPIFEVEPYREGIEVMTAFAAKMRDAYGLKLEEFSPGGGFPVQYTPADPDTPLSEYADLITTVLREQCQRQSLGLPTLVVEPGRAIVARAGVAVYTVGAVKDIPGVRKYVSVDGGMGDNIRPAIYGSRYEAAVAGRVVSEDVETVTLAGKYCESGDVLIRDVELPRLSAGDVVAIPTSGAYCLPMASNYNATTRPAIVMVSDGKARLMRRRESYEDLMRLDVD